MLVDSNQLELALLNLCVNARDAMPGGGCLRLSADVRDGTNGVGPGRYVCLTVSDTGQGMDEATLRRAVEPFFSTKEVGRGTGLGLSMAHGLAAQSGGLLELASTPGAGTHATLWLPLAQGEGMLEPRTDTGIPTAPRRAVVLLVDDEPLVRQSTAEGMRELGYDVVEAGSAKMALEITGGGLRPDILVTDYMMPGMTGTQLIAELQARLPGLPSLMVTGFASLSHHQMGGIEVLRKPFRQADLANRLTDMLTGPSRAGS